MADNFVTDAGSGGNTYASDDISSVHYPRAKLSLGADGTAVDAVPVVNGMDTTATGVQAVGIVAQLDDSGTGTVTENQFGPVRMSSRRALLVEGVASGTVIPVSDGSGSLTVDGTVGVSGTVTVDGSGVTQPVSHAALTELAAAIDTELQVDIVGALPAGTNAIGKLAANSGVDIGDVDVTSVIPGSGATNLGKAEDASHSSGDVGVMALAVRRDSAAASSGTDGDYEPLSTDNTGQLRVNVGTSALPSGAATAARQDTGNTSLATIAGAVSGTEVQVDVLTSALPTGAATSAKQDTIIGHVDGIETLLAGGLPAALGAQGALKIEGVASGTAVPVSIATVPSHAVTNAGTFATQVDGAALTALQLIDNPVLVDDAAFTPATSSVMMAGYEADEGSTDSVDEGDAGAARMTLDRKQIVTPQPHTTGGLSTFRSIDVDESEEEIKASAGQVYGWYLANLSSSPRFVKFYNDTAANVAVGTTAPKLTLPLPANSTNYVAGHMSGTHGITFDTAICIAATTGLADNDTGAPSGNDVVANVFYK